MTIGIDPDSLFEPPPHERESKLDVHAVRDAQPSSAFNTINIRPPAARLEIEDAAYHEGSAVTLPLLPPLTRPRHELWSFLDDEWAKAMQDSAPEHYELLQQELVEEDDDWPVFGRSTLLLAAIVIEAAGREPSARLIVAGHADAGEGDAEALSAARAQNFLAIVAGDRDLFVTTTKQYSRTGDMAVIGSFLASTFGWPWTAQANADFAVAAALLRRSYNAAAKQKTAAPFFPQALPDDSPQFTDADLGALYDCYQFALAALLGVTTPDALATLRAKLRFADDASPSFGYGDAIARDKQPAWRSHAQRRVEAVFVAEENVTPLIKRGMAHLYDRDLFSFAHYLPHWLLRRVWLASDEKPQLGEEEDDGTLDVEVTIPKKPEGLDYFDDLLKRPPSWPGDDEDEKWQPSE